MPTFGAGRWKTGVNLPDTRSPLEPHFVRMQNRCRYEIRQKLAEHAPVAVGTPRIGPITALIRDRRENIDSYAIPMLRRPFLDGRLVLSRS
jgi:hypothetical protein